MTEPRFRAPQTPTACCGNCRFAFNHTVRSNGNVEALETGDFECRRYPPTFPGSEFNTGKPEQPLVKPAMWCGEHQYPIHWRSA